MPPTVQQPTQQSVKQTPMTTSAFSAAATVLDLKALAGLRADEQPTLGNFSNTFYLIRCFSGSLLADPHTKKILFSTPNVFQNLESRILNSSTESSSAPSSSTTKDNTNLKQ